MVLSDWAGQRHGGTEGGGGKHESIFNLNGRSRCAVRKMDSRTSGMKSKSEAHSITHEGHE